MDLYYFFSILNESHLLTSLSVNTMADDSSAHAAICGSATSICNSAGLSALWNLITRPFCVWRTPTTESLCLVETKMLTPSPCGLGCRTPDVQSGPTALELRLYNNPLFTYTAEAVKTANRFFNGRQLKHPCRARAPSPRQERRRVKSVPWLLSSSELRWREHGVCHYSNKMGPIFSAACFSLVPRLPSVWIGMHMVPGKKELLWNISLERLQFTHHKIAEQYCK